MGGTIIGVFLIQAFNTGLTMVNVPSFWQYVAKGALLLFALTSDFIRKHNREKQLLEASKKNGCPPLLPMEICCMRRSISIKC